jgi:hypothetical protein
VQSAEIILVFVMPPHGVKLLVHIMGFGGRTPLTQLITVTLTPWVGHVRPPQPEKIHADGTAFCRDFLYA